MTFQASARWADYTSMGAGLSEFFLAEPATMDELSQLILFLRKKQIGWYPLGDGTNVIGSDHPIDRVVIRLGGEFRHCSVSGTKVIAGAGCRLASMIASAAAAGLGGAAGLSGIPGTIGGALRMNAGANGIETADLLRSVEYLLPETGEFVSYISDRKEWSYRTSPLPENGIILRAVFEFRCVDAEQEKRLLASERERRKRVTPKGRSAGSVFRNPSGTLSAGVLLERAGCKSLRYDGLHVSHEHANWIVNFEKKVSESDCTALAVSMASRVKAASGAVLKTELRFVNMESKQKIDAVSAPLNILLLKGGTSAEREVSLISGAAVAEALREAGHSVEEYDITELKITDAMRNADVVYPVLHGGFGEDGRLQKLLEDAGIKFVGSSSKACIDIMDKITSKKIMDANGIRTPKSLIVSDVTAPFPEEMGLPLIVKPPKEGSTFGLTLVTDRAQWCEALELSFRHGAPALVEEYIKGVEATVGILDGKPLPLIEIRYPGALYDYDAKYTHAHGKTQYLCPPTGISAKAQNEAQDFALRFYQAVGARDMLRVDVIVSDKDDSVWVLEGNGLPGCTPSSLLPKAAQTAGISFPEMCSRLARAAAER